MTKLQKLAGIRAEIEALSAERDTIETAPIPRAEAAEAIDAVVNAPVSGTLIGPGGPNPRADLDPAPSGLSRGSFNSVGLLEMLNRPRILSVLFPEQITKYLLSVYDAQTAGIEPGLPAPQRRKRLAELDAEIFALEVTEESLCETIEADGGDVLRRGDADPRAQLGLDTA